MNLKLSALIICSALFSLSASLTQGQAADNEKLRAMLLALPAPTIAVTPVDRVYPDRDSKNINLPEKREQSELPPTQLYVCEQPRLKGRCEGLPSKRGFCCKCYFHVIPPHFLPSPAPPTHIHTTPSSYAEFRLFLFVVVCCCAIDLTRMIILDKLENGWKNKISSLLPQPMAKCTLYGYVFSPFYHPPSPPQNYEHLLLLSNIEMSD